MDEKRVACGCKDGTVFILDLSEGIIGKWKAHDEIDITAIAALNDLLVTGSRDCTAKLWKVKAGVGVCLKTFEGHLDYVLSVRIMADGGVVTGSKDGGLRVDGVLLKEIHWTEGSILCVSSLLDGRIVSAGQDKVVKIWNSGGQGVNLVGHEDMISCLAVSSDGNIISGSWDGTVRIWDPTTLRQIKELRHGDAVESIATHNEIIVSGTRERTIRVWDRNGLERILGTHSDWVTGLCVVDEKIVSCSEDDSVRVWDINSAAGKEPDRHSDWVTCMCFLADGRAITGSSDEMIRVWNQSGETLATLSGHNGKVEGVTACTDGTLVSVSEDRTLRIWNGDTFELMKVFREAPEGYVECVDRNDDGRVVNGYRSPDGCHGRAAISSVFAIDGGKIITVTFDGKVTMYICEEEKLTEMKTVECPGFFYKHDWENNILLLLGERAVVLYSSGLWRSIGYGNQVLGTLESDVFCGACYDDNNVVGLGLRDGRVAFFKVVKGDGKYLKMIC